MRLIDSDALMKEFEIRQKRQINEYCDCFLNDAQNLSTEWYCVEDIVEAAPTIEAEPVQHGRWIRDDLGRTCCSVCEKMIPYVEEYDTDEDCGGTYEVEIDETPYCPNCGAKMDLEG